MSCAGSELCVAIDDAGNVVTTTDPTGAASAWTTADIDGSNLLSAVSCPSSGLCVAGDDFGNVVTTTDPTGGASAWTTTNVDSTRYVSGVSCPTGTLCLAVDDAGNAMSGTSPSPPPGWPANFGAPSISGSPTEGQTLMETHGSWTNSPTSFAYQWERCDGAGDNCQAISGARSQTYMLTAADVGSTIRVGETAINAVGAGPSADSLPTAVIKPAAAGGASAKVSAAQVLALMKRQIVPSGKAARIAVLSKRGAYKLVCKALEPGTVVVHWYEVPSGATLATKTKPRPVLIATGRRRFSAAGDATMTIRLTSAGKRLLKHVLLSHASRLKLTAKGTFTPSGKAPITGTKGFVLKAGG